MRRAFLSPRRRLAAGGVATAALAAAFALGPGAGAFAATGQHTAAAGRHTTIVHLNGKTYSLVLGHRMGIKLIHPGKAPAAKANTLSVHSSASTGVVTPTPKVYLVFWGSQWKTDPAKAKPALQAFFKGLFGSADTWGTILNQYCEGVAKGTTNCGSNGTHITHPSSSLLGGVFFDKTKAPTKATAAQLAAEAVKAANHFHATATDDLNWQYVIASAHGTHPDGFPNSGFCAYHNSTSASGVGQVAWTNLPYIPDLGKGGCTTLSNPSLLDGYFSTETHEYAETDTDVFPANGWLASNGSEIGDLCVNLDGTETLSTGTFDVQGLWSNLDNKCVTKGP